MQRGGKLKMPTLIIAVLILAALVGLYMFLKKTREGFQSEVTVRYYFLPTCSWCNKFNPEWEAFVNNLEQDKKLKPELAVVKTEKVDGSTNKVPVEGFPTVHLIDKQGKVQEFTRERTATALMEEALKIV